MIKCVIEGTSGSWNAVHVIYVASIYGTVWHERRKACDTLLRESKEPGAPADTAAPELGVSCRDVCSPQRNSSSHHSGRFHEEMNSLNPESHAEMWKACNSPNNSEREQNWAPFPGSKMCAIKLQDQNSAMVVERNQLQMLRLQECPLLFALPMNARVLPRDVGHLLLHSAFLDMPAITPPQNFNFQWLCMWRIKRKEERKHFLLEGISILSLRKENRVMHWNEG